MMRHLFTYGSVPVDQVDRVALKETEIGPVPEEWEIISLGEASEFLQYGTSQRCHEEPTGSLVLRIPNVIGGEIETTDLKFLDTSTNVVGKLHLEVGDILFVRTNGRREYTG